jgi:hypothetical protein
MSADEGKLVSPRKGSGSQMATFVSPYIRGFIMLCIKLSTDLAG